MSDTFQANYKTASNIVKNINSILATIKENNSLSEMQKQLSRVKQYFAQAQEALKIMRNTASVMSYNNKIQAMGSVRDIEQSLATIKKEIARQEAKLNKSSLVGAVVRFPLSDSLGCRGKEEEDGRGTDPASGVGVSCCVLMVVPPAFSTR